LDRKIEAGDRVPGSKSFRRRRKRAPIALLGEILGMARDSLLANKLRSALMTLGVIIGVTALVGMTALVRGFDQSLRALLEETGPGTVIVMKLSGVSALSGMDLFEIYRRPNLTVADARAIASQAPSVASVDTWLGGTVVQRRERISHQGTETLPMLIMGASENFSAVGFAPLANGRFFTASEVRHRRNLVLLGKAPSEALFPDRDAIGQRVRISGEEYIVVGTLAERPNPGSFDLHLDDVAVIPWTRYGAKYGIRADREAEGVMQDVVIVALARTPELRSRALVEIEEIVRVRHGLSLDEPNDFDLLTQDTAVKVWEELTRVTFFGLAVMSSIALAVGGVGVMAVMTMAVTERTREIGVRKAVGAKNQEILLQFLIEAAFLTSIGGVIGVITGSAVGLLVHFAYDFPVSLPWWSFALGVGVSTVTGIGFGTIPAVKASHVNPIEALHYE
jgi:putative ABC transport system permease protein